MTKKLYNSTETANMIGVSRATLYGWIARGVAKPYKSTHGLRPRHMFKIGEINKIKENYTGKHYMAW